MPFEDKIHRFVSEDKLAKLYDHIGIPIRTWSGIFNVCKEMRKASFLADNELVVLLTDFPNEYNWFLGGDDQFNGFVHTAEWGFYFPNADIRFPIAYQIVSLLLKQMLIKYFFELKKILHKTPKGCLMDYCIEKKISSIK